MKNRNLLIRVLCLLMTLCMMGAMLASCAAEDENDTGTDERNVCAPDQVRAEQPDECAVLFPSFGQPLLRLLRLGCQRVRLRGHVHRVQRPSLRPECVYQ